MNRDRPLCAETSRADAEPLAATASRVDRWILLEYRGLWAHDAVDDSTLSAEVKAHLRAAAAARAALADSLRAPHRAPGARRAVRLRRDDDGGRARPAPARARPLRRSARARSCHRGRAARPPALSRLHAREARPLLRQVRPAAVRRRPGAGRRGLGLAVDARRRRPVRRQPRLHFPTASTTGGSSPRRSGRCSRAPSPARSISLATAGRSCHSFPVQAAERAVREAARDCSASATCGWPAAPGPTTGWRVRLHAAGRRARGRRAGRRKASRPTSRARPSSSGGRSATSQKALPDQPPDEDEPARVVERSRELRRR